MKQCCVYLTDSLCPEFIFRYNQLRSTIVDGYDLYVLYDNSRNNIEKYQGVIRKFNLRVAIFNKKYLQEKYKRLMYIQPGSTNIKTGEIMDGTCFNCILPYIEFFGRHREYDYFWMIENDVIMAAGDWSKFFGTYYSIDSDLICTHYYQYTDHASLRSEKSHPFFKNNGKPVTYDLMYYNEPGKVAPYFSDTNILCAAFLPIARYSSKLMECLVEHYSKYYGFFEYAVPTVAKLNGLSALEISQEFYVKDPCYFNKGSISFCKIEGAKFGNVAFRQNNRGVICHPVKLTTHAYEVVEMENKIMYV